MGVIKNDICEFCGKKKKWLSANSFHGFYCVDCLRLSRCEDAECLKEIRETSKNDKSDERGKVNSHNNENAHDFANSALLYLAGGQFDATGKKISID